MLLRLPTDGNTFWDMFVSLWLNSLNHRIGIHTIFKGAEISIFTVCKQRGIETKKGHVAMTLLKIMY